MELLDEIEIGVVLFNDTIEHHVILSLDGAAKSQRLGLACPC
jgi:hypothetical protein